MKAQLKNQLKMKHSQIFHTKLYDSLEVLKCSNEELLTNLLKIIQENPLLEIEFNTTHHISLDESFGNLILKNDLKTFLYYQLNTSKQDFDFRICSYIIESLSKHGYFIENIEEASNYLRVKETHFIKNLRFIQDFYPIGVGAKNIREALIFQSLKDQRKLAEVILTDYLNELVRNDVKSIAKKLKVTLNAVLNEVAYIKTLNPYPCSDFSVEQDKVIIPDLKLEVISEQISISPIEYFYLSYNDHYLDLLYSNSVLKKYFIDAKTLLTNINKRNASLMLVMNELVKMQQGYFLYGDELNPCTQHEIAKQIGINTSTVSRAISNKYYEFNGNAFPIKDLFVSSTNSGQSSDAIKKAINEIIMNEDKTNPYSDEELMIEIRSYNLKASRRAISKYRDSLNIDGCRKRKIKYSQY